MRLNASKSPFDAVLVKVSLRVLFSVLCFHSEACYSIIASEAVYKVGMFQIKNLKVLTVSIVHRVVADRMIVVIMC